MFDERQISDRPCAATSQDVGAASLSGGQASQGLGTVRLMSAVVDEGFGPGDEGVDAPREPTRTGVTASAEALRADTAPR